MPFHADPYHFITPAPGVLAAAGFDPASRIVPMWFGFRFFLEDVPSVFPAEVTCRSQFKLFVNGTSILFGPCRSAKEIVYVDTIDIAAQLGKGENRIVMQVFSYPEKPAAHDQRTQGPNYCYGDSDGPGVCLVGDFGGTDPGDPANWRVWPDAGQGFNAEELFLLGANEDVNGAESLANPFFREEWDESRMEAAGYGSFIEIDAYGQRRSKHFEPRPIALLERTQREIPGWTERTVPANGKESFVLDAGELTTGYFRIGFRGGKDSRVTLTYAESYYQKDENGQEYKGVRDDASGFIHGVRDTYTVGGDAVYEPFRFRTFRFVKVDIETADEPLTVLPQPYVETMYPLKNSKKPVFTDARREKLYDVAFRTLRLCAHDTYEDCPYYEQLMYACDTRLEMLFTYASTDELDLPRQAIRLFAQSMMNTGLTQARFPSRDEQTIPAFALWFVMMLGDYVDQTGDGEFVRPFIPTAERIVETFLRSRTESGLLAPQGYWDYFDWTREWSERGACTPNAARDGESALQNLFFVYAAKSLIRLLPRYHRADLAAYYEGECEKLLRLVDERCWDGEKGLYKEGPFTEEYSQHTQIYAVLSGLAKGERARSVMEKTLTDKSLVQCSFMQGYYLFRALDMVGMYSRTEELWQPWQDFIDLHCTTFPETPYDPRSDCHAWSALPLSEFAQNRT